MITQPIKYHGGKHYIASKIVDLMPAHLHYVETHAGGLSVLFARDPDDERLWAGTKSHEQGVSELVNDIDKRLVNFWRTLQDEHLFPLFVRLVEAVPFSRDEWQDAHERYFDHAYGVKGAARFFIDARQSLAGRQKGFTGITRTRTRRRMNGNVSEWLGAVDGLREVHARLRRVLVENKDAVELIQREDTERTLFYADPPYFPSARAAPNVYRHEMTRTDHERLLHTLLRCKGKVMLSGYHNELYDHLLSSWRHVTFDLPNNAAGGTAKDRETEVLWMNW
jgi:DNA adenine methylase